MSHPRLYFDAAGQDRLRGLRGSGSHALIWRNLVGDAERYARQEAATEWIAPAAADPRYENLYDRFFAMLSDAAALEQLAFATAYGASRRICDAACRRLVAAAVRWRPEADLAPDYGTAYATTRLLKAVAVGYDLLWAALPVAERHAVRRMLTDCGQRLADEWFSRPDVAGPVGIAPGLHSPHHASVEWSAFGIVALCLLGDVDAASDWVGRAHRHFADQLLATAVARDGAPVEGSSFWASTVLSQLQFLDPLRRCTGVDLMPRVAGGFNLRLALAAYRPHRERTSVGEPWYGDSTGMSAILFAAAAELGDPALQRLAAEEPTTGRIETWPARTPQRGEQLRFAPGGYAYAWCSPDLRPGQLPDPTPAHFPSIRETYLRTGWGTDDLLVAIRSGTVSAYAGGRLAYVDLTPAQVVDVEASRRAGTGIYRHEPPGLDVDAAIIDRVRHCQTATDPAALLSVELDADRNTMRIRRTDGFRRTWAAPGPVTVRRGTIIETIPDGYAPDFSVGYGLLPLAVTDLRTYSTATVQPVDLELELTLVGMP